MVWERLFGHFLVASPDSREFVWLGAYLDLHHDRCTMANEPEMYRLFIVDKEHPGKPKSVTISKSAYIEDLQAQIKASHSRYEGVDSSDLDLYRIDVAANEDSEEAYPQEVQHKARDLSALPKLNPMQLLDNIYKAAPRAMTIHILVVESEDFQQSGE